MGETINSYKIVVQKPEGKRLFIRSKDKWEDNIRVDLREIRWEVVDRMHLAQDRDQWRAVGNMAMNLGFHKRWIIS
jgi:hypothetical protein